MRAAAMLVGTAGLACGAVHRVGPGQALTSLGQVPWESLQAGDSVYILARPEPYREKFVLNRRGTADRPIVVRGVPDAQGRLPVIDGKDAITAPRLSYYNEERSVIKIGGSSVPADGVPAYIRVESLEIRGARSPNAFTGRAGPATYSANASALYLEKGEHITIAGCTLTDCGNGFFAASASRDVVLRANYIHGNGVVGSIYEHNNYTQAQGMTFEFNRFGPLCAGCPGNNLKDRSAGLVVRYNWIEAGNRQLDLVDGGNYRALPEYRATWVYGNILIEPEGAGNQQVVHYGGDSEDPAGFRKGTLYFFHNTVVSTRTGNTTLFRLSTDEESVDCRNNILFTTAAGSRLAIVDGEGTASLGNNWLKAGWVKSHGNAAARVSEIQANLTGPEPGFRDLAGQDFAPAPGSACLNAGAALLAEPWAGHPATQQYGKHRLALPRSAVGGADIGALEAGPGNPMRPRPGRKVLAGYSSGWVPGLGWILASPDGETWELRGRGAGPGSR